MKYFSRPGVGLPKWVWSFVMLMVSGGLTIDAQTVRQPREFRTLTLHAVSVGSQGSVALHSPTGMAADQFGNLFVADTGSQVIRKIDVLGQVTVVAGSPGERGSVDGMGAAARFDSPSGIAVDLVGNLYVADAGNHVIRKITPKGLVSTLAGRAGIVGSADGAEARFYYPQGVAVDAASDIYVADTANHTIRKITATGLVSTVAGAAGKMGSTDGAAGAARFSYPSGITVGSHGELYVVDTFNSTVRRVSPAGVVTTLAGLAGVPGATDGQGGTARLRYPTGITTDRAGNLIVTDTSNSTIRSISPVGLVTTLAGRASESGTSDGSGLSVRFAQPYGITVDADGTIFVADRQSGRIRMGDLASHPNLRPGTAVADAQALEAPPSSPTTAVPPQPDIEITPLPGGKVYGTAPDGATLEWLEYPPTNGARPPWPAALVIHGGGFRKGSPTDSDGSITVAQDLAAAGYLALAITYRLAPPGKILNQRSQGRAPEQYDDCKQAVRAARADPRCNGHIAVVGGSAGACHAEWLALDHTTTITPPWSDRDRPDVTVNLSAPSDFTDYRPEDGVDQLVADVTNYCGVPDTTMPTPEALAILQANSPAFQVDNQVKPMLLVFSADDIQPYEQLGDMVSALDAAFGSLPKNYAAVTVPGRGHAFNIWPQIITGTETVRDRALAFIASAIRNPTPTPTATPTVTPTPSATPTPPRGKPLIETQPANQTVLIGQVARFSVSAKGARPLSYQWRKNGANILGAVTANYTTPPATIADNGARFSVVVSNAIGRVISADAVLTVTSSQMTPVITAQPESRTVRVGSEAAFKVTATGVPPLAYQWRKNGSNIAGANRASYTTPPTTSGDNGSLFSVVVSNSFGSVTSTNAVLMVR